MNTSLSFIPRRRRLLVALVLTGAFAALAACDAPSSEAAASSTSASSALSLGTEIEASPLTLVDYEFDTDDGLFVWAEADPDANDPQPLKSQKQSIRMGVVQADGTFALPTGLDGKPGIRVDTYVADEQQTGNGPEWVSFQSAAGGTEHAIVYTKYDPANTTSLDSNIGIAYPRPATTLDDGGIRLNAVWDSTGTLLPGTDTYNEPIGDLNPTQRDPVVAFMSATASKLPDGNPDDTIHYTAIDGAGGVKAIEHSATSNGTVRTVTGMNAIVYTALTPDPGTPSVLHRQAYLFDVTSGHKTQLTHDLTDHGEIFMWQAPDPGHEGEWVFFVVRDETQNDAEVDQVIDFYSYDPADGSTQCFQTIPRVGVGLPNIWSAESFTYGNGSYVFMERTNARGKITDELNDPSQIWLVSLDGTRNDMISDPRKKQIARIDPEVFFLASGPVIYYNEYQAGTNGGLTPPPLGVWFSPTGIPPVTGK